MVIQFAKCVGRVTAMWLLCGVAAQASDATVTSAGQRPDAVLARYGSIPKGVTVEGQATGFMAITQVVYEAQRNRFVLNNNAAQYDAPIARDEMKQLMTALATDLRERRRMVLGVSLRTDKGVIVYGKLDQRSALARDLAAADRVLGGVIHGTPDYLRGVRLPRNYRPAVARRRTINSAPRLNFTQYAFALMPGTTQYRRSGYVMEAHLVPVIPQALGNRGHGVDRERQRQGILGEPEDMKNFEFLKANIFEFQQMPEMLRAAAIGEAASFVRMLAANSVDIQRLAMSM